MLPVNVCVKGAPEMVPVWVMETGMVIVSVKPATVIETREADALAEGGSGASENVPGPPPTGVAS